MSTPENTSPEGNPQGSGITPPPYTPPAYQPSGPAASYPPPAYPAYGQPPQTPAGYGAYGEQRTNVLAIISMIASIVGFVWLLPFVGSLAGAIMGHISLKQIARTGEKGRGMALAGVIVGWAGLALFIVLILIIIFAAIAASSGVGYS